MWPGRNVATTASPTMASSMPEQTMPIHVASSPLWMTRSPSSKSSTEMCFTRYVMSADGTARQHTL
eukprot:2626416-Prymnesium_polylepis.1